MIEPIVVRANMKTAQSHQYAFAMKHQCFGVGWGIEGGVTGMSWERYSKIAERQYKKNPRWKQYMDLIHRDLAPGDFIWIRDDNAKFYLGCISGKWRYVASKPHVEADLVNIRSCEWWGPYTLDDVPGAVMLCRGPFRRITDMRVAEYTKLLYSKASGVAYARPDAHQPTDLFTWLSDSACEDLVALYLQRDRGYSIIPSTSKHSTAKYEWSMLHRETGLEAAVQVKNGTIALCYQDYEAAGFKVYLFTSGGEYEGTCPPNVEALVKDDLVNFALKNRETIPKTIRHWVDYLYPR